MPVAAHRTEQLDNTHQDESRLAKLSLGLPCVQASHFGLHQYTNSFDLQHIQGHPGSKTTLTKDRKTPWEVEWLLGSKLNTGVSLWKRSLGAELTDAPRLVMLSKV